MRLVACHSCEYVIQVGGDLNEVNNLLGLETTYACVTPLCRGRMFTVAPNKIPSGYKLRDMPIQAFYRAINGFGPGPDSTDPASLKRLRELLLSQKIVDLKAEQIGRPQRVILRELILEGGARLHFETSARGACVYYIEEPGPSCLEIVDDELSSAPATEVSDSNREEIRRTLETSHSRGASEQGSGGGSQLRAAELPESECVPSLPEEGGLLPGNFFGCCGSGSA